jgi:NADPH:quinone reductase-like Zn-dependent oxidoreductase
MKAVRILEYGTTPIMAEVPTPAVGDDEVLVKVKSTAVNHLDLLKASGNAKEFFPITLPWIPGHEFSGVVERIGSDVVGFAVGDPVFGDSQGGAFAECVSTKPSTMAKKPSNLSFDEAASVPVAAQTAWQALFKHGHLAKGQTVLIHGGAGGVGAYAVQMASHVGATVIVTASADDEAFLKSMGASRVIDYRTTKFEDALPHKVNVVFDLVGGDMLTRSYAVLLPGGYLIAANQPVSEGELAKHHASGLMMNMIPTAEMLGSVSQLLAEKAIKPDVAKVYALSDVAQAWADLAGVPSGKASGQPRPAPPRLHGKLVLKVG